MRENLVATVAARNLQRVAGKDAQWHEEMLETDCRMTNLTYEEKEAVRAWVRTGVCPAGTPEATTLPDHTDELPAQEALAAMIRACNDGREWAAAITYTAANYPRVTATHLESGKILNVRSAEEFARQIDAWILRMS